MSDNYESERFFSGSLDRDTFFDEYSFEALLLDDDAGGVCVISFALALSVATRDLASYFNYTEDRS